MNIFRAAVRQPVTVAVGVILVVLAGVLALQRVPIQLTPDVEDTIISVRTRWEGASPLEIEQEIVDPQEERLQGLANLRAITSTSQQGNGTVKLEFRVGTDKDVALREVSDKLREVPDYPENADEPVVEASDPENRDYIAWFILSTDDPEREVRTLNDFATDRVKPVFERVAGVSESNVLGGREREVQIRFDPLLLAQRGVSPVELVAAIRRTNRNISAGSVEESKRDVRIRLVNQYESVPDVEATVIKSTTSGPVTVGDVATIVETWKEPFSLVRSRGEPVLALNAQKEVGANVMEVMAGLREAVARLNEPGGVLDQEARRLGIEGGLKLEQVYDQTVYIDDALALVEDNIWLGGALALAVLLIFLGSVRGAAIIALAIPISVVGAVVAMLALGRTVNVISLAGMAFAVGMVVDNAIVVLENIFRHLEMGKPPLRASVDGTREVFGAVLAATLTTVVVFVPILLIEEEAGQLFRDIALAIVAAVSLSLVVSVTVIPAAAARLLKRVRAVDDPERGGLLRRLAAPLIAIPDLIAGAVHRAAGSTLARLTVVVVLTAASLAGTDWLMPPSDYLPQGNRNLVFGLLIPPPGYNLAQQERLAARIESTIEPFWEAGRDATPGDPNPHGVELPSVPTIAYPGAPPGPPVTPPPLENYFVVSVEGAMFHGGIASDPSRVVDLQPLFDWATRPEVAPGVLAFAFQVPLFRLGGRSGSAVKVNFTGDDLDVVSASALAAMMRLMGEFGPGSVQPDPSNFNIPGPELRLEPDPVALSDVGMSASDLGTAVAALGDGAIIGDYRIGGQTIDLKVMSNEHGEAGALASLVETPIATPAGRVVPLGSLARISRVPAANQINRDGRRRAVTLQVSAPAGMPLEQAVATIATVLDELRASGALPPSVETDYTGSASKLAAVRRAMLGDGTFAGTAGSSLVLALVIVYLLMCVLFQSFQSPLVILFSVPLATLGGFAGLYGVHVWSMSDPYLPVQNLDVLTMLGFVILIGVVVNNAILIVHQTTNFMRGEAEDGREPMAPREAITEAVRTRVRPIFMSTLTSVGGMAPLVFMPGSGSELYRGLGSVVVGGLLVSTVFTLALVPMLLSLVLSLQERLGLLGRRDDEDGDGTARPATATAAVALLGAAVVLGGCAQTERERDWDAALRSIAVRQTARATEGEPAEVRLEPADLRLPAGVAKRRAELEALGGEAAWAAVEAPLPRGTDGRVPDLAPVQLEDALALALEHHLGVRIRRLEAEAAIDDRAGAEAAFDSVFFSDFTFDRIDQPQQVSVLNNVALGTDERGRDRWLLQSGLRRRSETGATMSAGLRLERQRDRTPGLQFQPDPSYWSGFTAEVRQPLLRGAGRDVNRADIALADNAAARSTEALVEETLSLAAAVEAAYWDLREAWSLLRIRAELLRRGEETARTLQERRVFDAAPPETSDALATVELRRGDLVRAQRALQAASDRLRWLVHDPERPLLGEALLVPADPFDEEPLVLDLREAVERAVARRPVVRRARLAIDDADVREMLAENGDQGQLDVFVGVAIGGLETTWSRSVHDLADEDGYGWSTGISYEIPIGNQAARAALAAARRRKDVSFLAFENVVRDVAQEVREAVRDLRTAWDLIAAARSFRLSQTENLRALRAEEERRSSLTPEFLNLKFSREERLASAQSQEVQAVADYQRARARLRRAMGALRKPR